MSAVSYLERILRNESVPVKELGDIQKSLVEKVSDSFYSKWFPKAFGVFYNFSAAQIHHIKFYYDFDRQKIKFHLFKEIVDGEDIHNKQVTEKIEEISKEIGNVEFLMIEPIEDNDGYIFYAKESRGKIRLICSETANFKLKEVVEAALNIINEKR